VVPARGRKSVPRSDSSLVDTARSLTFSQRKSILAASKNIGNKIMAVGLTQAAIPDKTLHYTVHAKYSYRPGMSANEAFLSRSAYSRYSKGIDDPRYTTKGFTHSPKKDQFLSTHIVYETRDGGREFAHGEHWYSKEKRTKMSKAKGSFKFLGGAAIRYGVPILLYGAMAYEFYTRYQEGGFKHAIHPFTSEQVAYDLVSLSDVIGDSAWSAAQWGDSHIQNVGQIVHGWFD